MKKLAIILICFILFGCSNEKNNVMSPNNELKSIILENNYVIVDVRTKEEYQESHLKNAINIPYNEIDEDTKLDKNKTILVYCKSGNRSGIAKRTLEQLGFKVYDLGRYDSIGLPKE